MSSRITGGPICMECGHRDDMQHPQGLCSVCEADYFVDGQDVQEENEHFYEACKRVNMKAEDFAHLLLFTSSSVEIPSRSKGNNKNLLLIS